eukprot:4166637-Prymnesium_polylepis.1
MFERLSVVTDKTSGRRVPALPRPDSRPVGLIDGPRGPFAPPVRSAWASAVTCVRGHAADTAWIPVCMCIVPEYELYTPAALRRQPRLRSPQLQTPLPPHHSCYSTHTDT